MTDRVDGCPFVLYTGQRYAIEQTDEFAAWLRGLRDTKGRVRILARLRRLADGNAGDVKPVGDMVFEQRLMFGPGYRTYFTYRGDVVVLLLMGGDKGSQHRDIARARQLARQMEDGA